MTQLTWYLRRQLTIALAAFRRRFGIAAGFSLMNRLYPSFLRTELPVRRQIRYLGRHRLHVDIASPVEWAIFANGVYEADTIALLSKLVKPGDIVLEIGGNIGSHTLLLSDLVVHGHVYVFEPFPPVFEKLHKNLSSNNIRNVTALPKAISSSTGVLKLHYKPGPSNEGLTSSYATYFSNTVEVPMATIDDVCTDFAALHVIKMDIQGGEYNAMLGATATLRKFKPIVLFEYDYNAKEAGIELTSITEYFANVGYSVYSISSNGSIKYLPEKFESGNLIASSVNLI